MGINDRDYYRDDEPAEFRYETRQVPAFGSAPSKLVLVLMAINIAVFVLNGSLGPIEALDGQSLNGVLKLSWSSLQRFELWRLVTHGFCHGSVGHIVFNMFGLWTFGRMAEAARGTRETAAFYLVALVVSGMTHSLLAGRNAVIGASGAISAITILSAFYFGRQRMSLMLLPIVVELRWMAIGYVLMDAFGVAKGEGGIAYWSHLGGAAFAVAYHLLELRLMPGSGRVNWESSSSGSASSLPWREREEPSHSVPAERPNVRIYEPPTDTLEADLDRVLDKINREGRASLTAAENEILNRASERFRQRR